MATIGTGNNDPINHLDILKPPQRQRKKSSMGITIRAISEKSSSHSSESGNKSEISLKVKSQKSLDF